MFFYWFSSNQGESKSRGSKDSSNLCTERSQSKTGEGSIRSIQLNSSSVRKRHLQSAKEEGDLPGLSFLDSARGLNPIVQKLPFYLQEKWVSVGASYKREYQVSFPQFYVFVDFVSQEATVKNDPSFNFATHLDPAPRPEKPSWRFNRQREVSVHKTEVFPNPSYESYGNSKKTDDCNKLCPVHKKPHALLKCRAFREKSIEEHKTFLKENNICFRCCASSTHFAKRKAKVLPNAAMRIITRLFTQAQLPGAK